MKSLLFLTCGMLTAFTVANAQDLKETGKEVQVVHLISDLTKERDGAKVQVRDFVLDLETGHAALQILSWQHTDHAKSVIAVAPYSPKMDIKQATQLAKELSSTEPPALTRKLAATLNATFGQDVYWSKYISRLPSGSDSKFDKEKYELVPFATIKNKKVVDVDGEALGTLVDVGLRDSGEIVYCVLQSSDEALRAIPLGAFLNRGRDKDWEIELKREQVFQFIPNDFQNTPQEIDLGWQEYVAVRYGRDALQEVPKAGSTIKSSETKDE